MIEYTGETSAITDVVGGIFGSFGGIIALIIGVILGIWVMGFMLGVLKDVLVARQRTKSIARASEVLGRYGYEYEEEMPEELEDAIKTMRHYKFKVHKG